MRLPRTFAAHAFCHERATAELRRQNDAARLLSVAELRIFMRVFCLTIFFINSIQLSNCDDVMSQTRENRKMATKKKAAKKAAKKKKH